MDLNFRRFINKIIKPSQKAPLVNINNNNIIFIHINKTGGTSIINALGIRNKLHLTAKEIIDEVGYNIWCNSTKFTVVRNPWDKVLSHYKYRVKTNQTNLRYNSIDFNTWVKKTYGPEKDNYLYDNPKVFQPQSNWLKNYQDNIDINTILRFENLNVEANNFFREIGLTKNLKHLNKTTKSNYKIAYDNESREIVANWFKEDLVRFDYHF